MKILKDLKERTQRWWGMAEKLTLAENGEKARPFSAKGPFYSGWPGHVRGPNVPPHACHVRRPNLRFGGRTWTSLTYAFGGLKHTHNACMFGGRTWGSAAEPEFSSKVVFMQKLISFLLKIIKTLKHFMKTCFYPTRGFRHPRFHRTVGIPIPESSRVLHSPPLKNIRPRMFLN